MSDGDWERRAERFDKQPVRTTVLGIGLGWFLALVVIVLALITSAALWAAGVFTSDLKGRGDAEVIKNSAKNRIEKQELFEDLYAQIKSTDANINVTAEALKAKPGDPKLSAELNGQKQFCNDLVGKYDAEARKFTSEAFRAIDLPPAIDTTDRLTDCKEDTR